MSVISGLAVYLIVWWVVLFAVLPWGVTESEEPIPGEMAGAPARPRLLLKMAVTTVLAGVIWLGIFALIESGWISFRAWVRPS